ncbi:MAG: hypothetical protein EBS01_15620, partial [Verrucomicrobia bacterium]|nr:hypothetical protein [Verrucomicrobiota bacterium]
GSIALVKAGASSLTLSGTNTYSGITYVDQGALTLNNATANGTTITAVPGDLSVNGGNVTLNSGSQIARTSNITLNGSGSTLTLAGNNVLNGTLTFANPGGTANPTLALGAGSLTFGGSINATNDVMGGTSVVPTISGTSPGYITLNNSTTVNVGGLAPLGLDIASTAPIFGPGGLTKTGSGGLRLNATGNAYAGTTALNGGVLFLGAAGVIPDFSLFTMAGGTLDINGVSEAISQLSGSGMITNNSTTSATLTFGLNNANTAFSGAFNAYSLAALSSLNMTKVGSGTLSFTGSGTSTGNLTVSGGSFVYSGGAYSAFGTNTINTTGQLVLDNTSANVNNRLGGLLKNLTLNGGEMVLKGSTSATSYESLNAFTPGGAGASPQRDRKSRLDDGRPPGRSCDCQCTYGLAPCHVPCHRFPLRRGSWR